ncbi:hypothetical protein CTI12_AA185930 [Artemisia annua]|uniref:Uncharacterized protein n=1 Tax=Artemisia annua TaxID=35608 RepID=A0A2U1P6Z4_ARTAN|nr:hypothetical protein CTI12_AA185930 [Artemisia annua]
MKCRKHTTDLTSLSGVCASCLRDRLLLIIQAQEQANNTSSTPSDQSQSQPPQIQRPLNKPRHQHTLSEQPHIAITNSGCIGHATSSSSSSKKNLIRFASFSNLFRSSHNNQFEKNRSYPSVTSSPSIQRRRYVRNRGVSPVRSSDCENDDEFDDESSEYESAESTSCKQTPQKTPLRRVNGGGGTGGWIFCLSPLVRARSPSRLWSMKGKGGSDGVVVPHLSYAKSFVANRSRKLADFGRSTDPNR